MFVGYLAAIIAISFLAGPLMSTAHCQAADWPMLAGTPERIAVAGVEKLHPPLSLIWRFRAGEAISGSVAVANSRLFVGSFDHNVYAINALTGEKLWSFKCGDWLEATPAVADGTVFVGSYDTYMYALDAATGKLKWKFKTGDKRRAGIGGWGKVKRGIDSSAAVAGGAVYFGCWDGFVYALEAKDGTLKWKYDAEDLIHWSSPAVADDRVFIGVARGTLLALNQKDGKLLWRQTLTGPHVDHMMCGPSVAEGVVYSGAGYEGGFFALEATSGRELWQFTANGMIVGTPLASGGMVYIYSDHPKRKEGILYALNAKTGKEKWRKKIGGYGACCPVLAGGNIYLSACATASGNTLFAFDAKTGREVWKLKGTDIWGSPAIAMETLFIGRCDGWVEAYRRFGQ